MMRMGGFFYAAAFFLLPRWGLIRNWICLSAGVPLHFTACLFFPSPLWGSHGCGKVTEGRRMNRQAVSTPAEMKTIKPIRAPARRKENTVISLVI